MLKRFFKYIKPKAPFSNYFMNIGIGFIIVSAIFDTIEFIKKKLF